ncbi:hypothetical protein Dimus_006730 [Dionaea muscipula]
MADEAPLTAEPPLEPPTRPTALAQEVPADEPEKGKLGSGKASILPAVSFKEESNLVSDLSDFQRRALDELKKLVQESLDANTLISPPPPSETAEEEMTAIQSDIKLEESSSYPVEAFGRATRGDVSIWGIPLLKDERSDVVLLKFLRARDFRVSEAFDMVKRTLSWRRGFGIEMLLEEEDLGDDLGKVVFMRGHDRDGHPVCYNVYGEFQNKELYAKTFSDEGKTGRFLRWRIQFLERSVRKLDFGPGGVNTIFQVYDLKNAPGPGRTELRRATRQALILLQDNYPEFAAKQVFINVPWWYIAFYAMLSPFMTQRTKSKFVFAGPSRTADTLFKYISPEQVPIQYGGLCADYCDCNPEFTINDPATEVIIKPTTKQFVEILVSERCVIVWEVRVVGWEVSYGAEFVPNSKFGYTVIVHKARKLWAGDDDPVIRGRYKISEVGKIVITIDNPSFKKRKLLYRFKVLPYSD